MRGTFGLKQQNCITNFLDFIVIETIKTGNFVVSGCVRITPGNLENAGLYLGQEISLMISCLGSG